MPLATAAGDETADEPSAPCSAAADAAALAVGWCSSIVGGWTARPE
tara:strand:- start:970 stop:1107 length:138 start_codon:yes stop_codon:yes gene_type:complete